MGGSHKKKLRAEKAKVKLKGAKLPKGLNVTKTEFKVKKITIRDQLKESIYNNTTGQRHINLKENLSRLKHHSSNFRIEALRNLREAILAGQPGVTTQLGDFIQSISAICLDIDKETRRESFKTLGILLSTYSEQVVEPFFHVISSYLRCAMTHIQPTIQEDALLMLDVLLQNIPQLLAEQSTKIFQNFLEMISRVRAEGDQTVRTLTVNMNNKQTTVKWRTKVLQRLQIMLQIQAEYKKKNLRNTAAKSKEFEIHTFNAKEAQYFPIRRSYGAKLCDMSDIFCRSIGSSTTAQSGGTAVDDTFILRGHIEHLMPLLLEAWIEVRPQQTTETTMQLVLSSDAAVTLKVILEIIGSLWTLVEVHENEVKNQEISEWFRKQYRQQFTASFLQMSLYQSSDLGVENSRSKHGKHSALIATCHLQNINLAYLVARFHTGYAKKETEMFSCLLQYLTTIVNQLPQHPLEEYNHLLLALHAFLYTNGLELLQLQICLPQMRHLLRETIAMFLGNHFMTTANVKKDGTATKVLVLLCEIVQTPSLFAAYGAEEFKEFLEFLPKLLLKPTISESALLSMSVLGKQMNLVFLQSLEKVIEPIIENLSKIQVLGAPNAFEGRKPIMNLFYWTERGALNNAEKLKIISKAEECIIDKRILGYFKSIFI